ncbi:Hsp20 family protein [uncultured Clostridium sp.]|uniref:Hsp20/alpha crystallin family protein n=1 Tax=uncultured Clostridium sp. TaxID=59620 RepID=UPI0028EA43BF|nr:Hsp20 family protein [uncultured Clostridium sp.]
MKKQDDDNIGLGSIFRGLDKLINIVGDMIENEENEVDIKGALNDPEQSKKITANYGFNIKIGGENFKGLRDINTANKMKDNSNREKVIEPATDVFDEEERVLIVMELPGVSEEDIKIEIENNILKIEAEVNNNIYIKNVKLSFTPTTENITSQLNNSIYSIIINKISETK